MEHTATELKPNTTYVVEFNGTWKLKQIKDYIHYLEGFAGNGIRFVPSTKMAKIVKEKDE